MNISNKLEVKDISSDLQANMIQAIGQMMNVAAITDTQKELNHLLMSRFSRSHEHYQFCLFASYDVPLCKLENQYMWDFQYRDADGRSMLNGGILFDKSDRSWSSHT